MLTLGATGIVRHDVLQKCIEIHLNCHLIQILLQVGNEPKLVVEEGTQSFINLDTEIQIHSSATENMVQGKHCS